MFEYDYERFFLDRLLALRTQKGVSAREMSLALGQSENYINYIDNERGFPSMRVFFAICVYLGVTPKEFFDDGSEEMKRFSKYRKAKLPSTGSLLEDYDINARQVKLDF